MLMLKNINVTLGKGTTLRRNVLNSLTLTVQQGEFVVVIGNNGAGKSTMFNVISGFLSPDSGQVIFNGQDLTGPCSNFRSSFVSKVTQDPKVGTIENMTITEKMALAYARGKRKNFLPYVTHARRRFFQEKLALLNMGLEDRQEELVKNLSGGQRQALSLIMAILADSQILLLDEITAALDPQAAEKVMQLAAKILLKEQRTCIMITHNMSHAINYGSRLLVLKHGTFVKEYSSTEKQGLTPGMLAATFEKGAF